MQEYIVKESVERINKNFDGFTNVFALLSELTVFNSTCCGVLSTDNPRKFFEFSLFLCEKILEFVLLVVGIFKYRSTFFLSLKCFSFYYY